MQSIGERIKLFMLGLGVGRCGKVVQKERKTREPVYDMRIVVCSFGYSAIEKVKTKLRNCILNCTIKQMSLADKELKNISSSLFSTEQLTRRELGVQKKLPAVMMGIL